MTRPPAEQVEVARYGREEFLAERWRYLPGEHVTFLGPTKSGKTTLGFQLLAATAHRKMPAVTLVMKPKDATVTRWQKALDYRRVPTWPPAPSFFRPRPPGYVLWPKHRFDPDLDDPHLYTEMRKAILDSYRKGKRIVFGDEVYGLSNELGLQRELITVWSRGRSMECGLWAATQKPSHIPLWAYSQAEHIFLAYDPDKRSRDRFSEIGGIDPDFLRDQVMDLKRHEWFYIRRDGPVWCVIDK